MTNSNAHNNDNEPLPFITLAAYDAITGGQTQLLHVGDYVQIPAGMPHLFSVPAGVKFHYVVFNTRQ